MEKKELEQLKKEEYYSPLFRQINIKDFLKKPSRDTMKISEIEIPPIEPIIKIAADIVIPPIGGTTAPAPKEAVPSPGGATNIMPPIAKPTGPAGGALPPLPTGGAPAGGAGALPPLPGGGGGGALPPLPGATTESTPPEPPVEEKGLSDTDKDDILKAIKKLQDRLDDATLEAQMAVLRERILEDVKIHYQELEKEIKSLKDRKMPEREFFDTEGTYKEHLYGMTTRMLDEFLPQLFETVPDYSFIATQVSRVFDDGTVADALISLIARVVHEGMKYDFKIDVPVLNGLMQYPLYIQRGHKIIPLTKPEIKKELESLSYRREDIDEIPTGKTNKSMFKNIGENPTRRPNHQKWYDVKPTTYQPVGLAADHKYSPQRGTTR